MYCLENLKYNRLYKKQFLLPYVKENKLKGSAILLLTPSYEFSNLLMNSKFCVNKNRIFQSYYVEKDIMYTINNESRALEIDHYQYDQNGVMLEDASSVFRETTDVKNFSNLEESEINDLYCRLQDKVIFFNEMYDDEYFTEADAANAKYKRLLYNDRLRNNKAMVSMYTQVKTDNPWIRKTFLNYDRYKQANLFIDLYYYNQAYLNNNKFTIRKSVDMYYEFIRRFIMDKRITKAGYQRITVFVPVDGWAIEDGSELFDYRKNLNPISVIYKRVRFAQNELKCFDGVDFVFIGNNGYFKFASDQVNNQTYMKFAKFITKLKNNETIVEEPEDQEENSSDAIAANIISKIETNKGIVIHNLTGNANPDDTPKEADKAILVKKINDASKFAKTEDDALNKLEEDNDIKRILSNLEDNSDNGLNYSASRGARITAAQDSFMKKQFNGKSVKEMINESNKPKELPETSLPIDTINNEWHHIKTVNFEKEYDLEADILKCLNSLSDKNKNFPVSILDVATEDTSTSEDSIITYTVKCEGYDGKRFTLKFDIPKFRDHRFMRLRGNEKIFSIEMPLIPISKTSDSRTQIATFYNKLFVDRYNTSTGKSNPYSDRLIKTLKKYKGPKIKTIAGDNSRVCQKYNLPIDYIDIASVYSKIIFNSEEYGEITFYFNQDEIRKIPGVNAKNGLPIALSKDGKCLYYKPENNSTISQFIANAITDKEFRKIYASQSELKRATYSRCWVLNTYIPTIVILAHDIGLVPAMDLAGVKYNISENKSIDIDQDYIKLKDGYINFNNTYDSMMLMNGLKDCNTEDISIKDINKKATWVEQLDNFGGRNKSDGLDNFKDLMYDPITIEISKDYKLPTTYHEALIYASNLLVDNKYVKHTDLASNRYRTNEVIAAQFYRVLSQSYKEYAANNKRGKKFPMTMKQSAVIDLVLAQNTTSDLSVFQPLLEIEAKNTISTKGVSGLNSDRAYTLEKRSYDKSAQNIISMSTGFAGTVGVNRYTTIDASVVGGRGYFKHSDIKDNDTVTGSMSMTESLSPFMLSSDDPFRQFMTAAQTAKHGTPINVSHPQLITTGAQEALPYLTSDMFAFKAKKNGKVTEITNDYMLIQYSDGSKDYVDLSEQTKKNSDGGFYIDLQLTTNKKVGNSVKAGEVIAWDKKSFSNKIGDGKQLAYNMGYLAKVCIATNEDGFEDSGVCSEYLSKAMSSDIVVMKDVTLPASTNVLSIVKKGQLIREGEPLIIFQNAFDDEDANMLLKNLSIEDNDITTIGRSIVKSKVTGIISDIKIYRTCELKDMSESLQKIVNNRENEVKRLKSIAAGSVSNGAVNFDSVGKADVSGKMKGAENSVRIEIYSRYSDAISPGDKLSCLNANKVVLMSVYPDKDAPYTDFRPNEEIDICSSASSTDGRIITSIFKVGAMNKVLIELQRKCAEIYGKKPMTMHEIDEYFNKK